MDEFLTKLLLSMLLGGLIGIERQWREKSAGFRTIMLITIGTTLFTIISAQFGNADHSRIAAGIVTGIGFLGAGVIIQTQGHVKGLTTATTIWIAAAIGMGVGIGQYYISFIATGLTLIILWIFPLFELWLGKAHHIYSYEVVCKISQEKYSQLTSLFKENRLRILKVQKTKKEENMICNWKAYGTEKNHEHLKSILFSDTDILEFDVM